MGKDGGFDAEAFGQDDNDEEEVYAESYLDEDKNQEGLLLKGIVDFGSDAKLAEMTDRQKLSSIMKD